MTRPLPPMDAGSQPGSSPSARVEARPGASHPAARGAPAPVALAGEGRAAGPGASPAPSCPCCGGPLPDVVPVDALARTLPPTPALIVRAIAARPGISTGDLIERIWRNVPGGEPSDPDNVVRSLISQHRARLAEAGWAIKGHKTHGYRLVRA